MVSVNQAEMFNIILAKLLLRYYWKIIFVPYLACLITLNREIQKSKTPEAVYFNFNGNTVSLAVCKKYVTKDLTITRVT